jgi:hypothetical protein
MSPEHLVHRWRFFCRRIAHRHQLDPRDRLAIGLAWAYLPADVRMTLHQELHRRRRAA